MFECVSSNQLAYNAESDFFFLDLAFMHSPQVLHLSQLCWLALLMYSYFDNRYYKTEIKKNVQFTQMVFFVTLAYYEIDHFHVAFCYCYKTCLHVKCCMNLQVKLVSISIQSQKDLLRHRGERFQENVPLCCHMHTVTFVKAIQQLQNH